MSGIYRMPRLNITEVRQCLMPEGRLTVRPYADLRRFAQSQISQLCVEEGLYCIPTQELVDFLRAEIGDRTAIEIGSGNGVLAEALGIRATDNKMQEDPAIAQTYQAMGQAPVRYGPFVERLRAEEAVDKYQPQVVVGAWVTHRFDPREEWRGGNVMGIDEAYVQRGRTYLFVGNEKVHEHKPLLKKTPRSVKAEWLVSRSLSREKNVIWIWEG